MCGDSEQQRVWAERDAKTASRNLEKVAETSFPLVIRPKREGSKRYFRCTQAEDRYREENSDPAVGETGAWVYDARVYGDGTDARMRYWQRLSEIRTWWGPVEILEEDE